MTSNLGTENTVDDEPKLVKTIEHAGTLVEQIACSSAKSLSGHLLRCNREGRKNYPGHAVSLPPKPAQRIDFFLTLDGADQVIEHSRPDLVISVEAGISIAALQKLLAESKQWFPVCLPDENISLMEYINNGSSGPLEQGYGEARDLVLGMQVALGSGELIKCGGKVVKNVTGYDLPKLFCGARGTLCVPFSAHLRLFALPETSSTIVLHFKNSANAFQVASMVRRSGLPISCLEIVDSEIFQLLDLEKRPTPFANISRDETLLCIQIHGIASVVAELEHELEKLVGTAAWAKKKLEPSHEQELWKFLTSPSSFVPVQWLELCAPTKVLEQLLTDFKSKHKSGAGLEDNLVLTWTARPGRNKACIFIGDAVGRSVQIERQILSTDQIRNILAKNAAGSSTQVSIAFADDHFLWKVNTLPQDDAVLNELKHRLKIEYDPHGVLNPLASM